MPMAASPFAPAVTSAFRVLGLRKLSGHKASCEKQGSTWGNRRDKHRTRSDGVRGGAPVRVCGGNPQGEGRPILVNARQQHIFEGLVVGWVEAVSRLIASFGGTMQATRGEGLSAYELQRLANVERNENALRALGIVPLASPQRAASVPSHTAAKKRARDKSADTGPTRHSKRVQESAPVVYDEDAIYRKLLEEANAAPLRRVYQRQSRPVAGFSRGGGGSSSDENIFEDEVEPGEYAEEDAQIRALVKEHGMDWQPDSVLGLPLHKSRRSSSGYAGVAECAPLHAHGTTVFYAFSTRGSTAGQKEQLGTFQRG